MSWVSFLETRDWPRHLENVIAMRGGDEGTVIVRSCTYQRRRHFCFGNPWVGVVSEIFCFLFFFVCFCVLFQRCQVDDVTGKQDKPTGDRARVVYVFVFFVACGDRLRT